MSQDIVSDALSNIMNVKRAGKTEVVIKRKSKLLVNLLKVMHENKVLSFKETEDGIKINFENLNECKAIKPRFKIKGRTDEDIEKYVRRYLPARNLGFLVVSTNKGLMTHEKALEEKQGGCLIAYFY